MPIPTEIPSSDRVHPPTHSKSFAAGFSAQTLNAQASPAPQHPPAALVVTNVNAAAQNFVYTDQGGTVTMVIPGATITPLLRMAPLTLQSSGADISVVVFWNQ